MDITKQLINQETTEAQYSKREVNKVWHRLVHSELDSAFLDFTLLVWYKLSGYLNNDTGSFTANKQFRLQIVNMMNMDTLIERIIEAVAIKPSQTYQEVVGYLQRYLPHPDALDRAKTAAEILAVCESREQLYWVKGNGPHRAHTIEIDPQIWVNIYPEIVNTLSWINTTIYNPPLIAAPLKASNVSCGYHTIKEPSILGFATQHTQPIALDVLDILNSIEWVIDPDVLAEQEVSSKPISDKKQLLEFQVLVTSSAELYELYGDSPFWLAWQYDSRGRMYSHGYHINFQSYEYKKALLNFSRAECLT